MMQKRKKGNAMQAVLLAVIFMATLVIYGITMYSKSQETEKPFKRMDAIMNMALTKETCVDLDKSGYNDRTSGATDVYTCSDTPGLCSVDLKNANVFALYFGPAAMGVPFTGDWDINGWSVTCEGKDIEDQTKPKTYALVKWDYEKIYPAAYLNVSYTRAYLFYPTTRTLIEPTESAYKPVWKCDNRVKVTVSTAGFCIGFPGYCLLSADTHGTDENVELCYYSPKGK